MPPEPEPDAAEAWKEPDIEAIDANGVDRAQIRSMLALPPIDRLRRMQQFLSGLMLLRSR